MLDDIDFSEIESVNTDEEKRDQQEYANEVAACVSESGSLTVAAHKVLALCEELGVDFDDIKYEIEDILNEPDEDE